MTYEAEVLADSPTVYWRLGESSGTVASDDSGNAHDGTYNGAPTLGATGLVSGDADTAITVNGSQGVQSVADFGSTTLTAWTFECIVNCSDLTSTYQHLVGFVDSLFANYVQLVIEGSGGNRWFGMQWFGTAGDDTGSGPNPPHIATATRYHVVATYDGTTAQLYVNGVAYANAITVSDGVVLPSGCPLLVGDDLQGDTYTGTIDEVAWYPAALSSGRVAAHYAAMAGSGSTITVPVLDASATVHAPAIGVATTPSGSDAAPTYTVKIVNMAGAVHATLTHAELDKLVRTLNTPDDWEFHFPKGAYTASDLDVLASSGTVREAQLYRNGDLMAWGPITSIDVAGSRGDVRVRGSSVDWYLNRRFLDGVIPNHIANADFESGTTGWSKVGSHLTFTADTTTFVTGQHSAKLVQTNVGVDEYIGQTHVISAGSIGLLLTMSAWFYIDDFQGDTFAAPWNRGLYIAGFESGVFQIDNGYAIDSASPRAAWTKASATVWIPPNKTWLIDARLYAPQGTVFWDDVKLVEMDSVDASGRSGLTQISEDIAHIISTMVRHVQNPAVGKSDLNIGYHVETTGTKLIKVYQWVDHVQFDQALQELLDRNDGADYTIDLTPTSRTFHSYANKRGTDRSGSVTLRYSVSSPSTSNTTDYRMTRDGAQCITRQTVIGSDNGPDREQGEDADASNVAGIILQDVRQASQDAETSSLQPFAEERIARFSEAPETIELDVKGSAGLIPTLKPGDLVTVVIDDGFTQINAVRRIMSIEYQFVKNLQTVTVAKDSL